MNYQHSRQASKCNAFCWDTGEPSLWNSPQQLARARIQANRAAKLGVAFYAQHTTNFKPLEVGRTVAADRARNVAKREMGMA